MNDDKGMDYAIQTQEAANAINKALNNHSNGARFFGLALYLSQWLHHNTQEADWEEQIEAFENVVRNLLKAPHAPKNNFN